MTNLKQTIQSGLELQACRKCPYFKGNDCINDDINIAPIQYCMKRRLFEDEVGDEMIKRNGGN